MRSLVAINEFQEAVKRLTDECTLEAKRYGLIIENKNKQILEQSIHCAADCLRNCLGKPSTAQKSDSHPKNGTTKGNQNSGETAEETEEQSLASILKKSRDALIDYLFLQAVNEKNCWNKLFRYERTLYHQMQNGNILASEAVRKAVETYVDDQLNFPRAQEMIDLIDVEFDYYDISDELLAKKDFAEIVEKFDIEVRDYQEGYEKNKQMSLFEFPD